MTSSPHSTPGASGRPTDPADRRRSRRASAIPLAIVVVGLLELAILVLIGVNTSLWWSVLIVVVGWLVGVALLVAAGQQSFVRVRSLFRAVRGSGDVKDHLSRPAFTMLSALLFFFPGLLTDLAALVLLADAGFSDEEALRWLFTEDESLPGRPIDALRDGRKTEIRRRAQALAW